VDPGANSEDPVERAAALAALGHRQMLPDAVLDDLVGRVAADDDARVRAAALGALARRGDPHRAGAAWRGAVTDLDAVVRRRAAELAPTLDPGAAPSAALVGLLDDPDVTVVEAAAWALGERGGASDATVDALAAVVRGHADALAREAAVAALGAVGARRGLPAVLDGCADVATVRRRAVLALAPFDGPEVDAALERATTDRDWQVRQAAEDLRAAGAAPDQ
jgi:HEAT repeat protein